MYHTLFHRPFSAPCSPCQSAPHSSASPLARLAPGWRKCRTKNQLKPNHRMYKCREREREREKKERDIYIYIVFTHWSILHIKILGVQCVKTCCFSITSFRGCHTLFCCLKISTFQPRGGFLESGYPTSWMVNFMENPICTWMRTGST